MKNLLLLCVTVATGLCGCGQSEEKAPDPVKEYDSFLEAELSQSDNLVMLEFDLVHAYQDGKWVSRGGTATILSVVNPDGEHMVMPNGKRFDGQTFKFGSLEDIFAGGVQ